MTALYALCLAYQYAVVSAPTKVEGGEVPGINASAIREAAGYAWPTLAFWIVAYVLLDRLRPQRLATWWLALGWGGAVATAGSLVINTWASQQMQVEGGVNPAAGARVAIYVAPFVEEATKASILFFIALAHRYRLVSKLSGIVLAGLSAAGFAFTENIIYYARAIVYSSVTIGAGDPEEAVNRLVMMRGVFLAFGHPLFTTATGVGLLVGLRSRSRIVRVAAPVAGYLIAAFGHMCFNTGATFLSDPSQQMLVYFLMVLPLVIGVVSWVVRQLLVESRRLRARLDDFVTAGWLSPQDAWALSRGRSRWRATVIALSRGWRPFMATLGVQRAGTELAYLRDAQVRGVVDAAGDDRAHALLVAIAEARPLAVIDPRGQKVRWPDVRGAVRRAVARLPRRRQAVGVGAAVPIGYAPVGSAQYSPVDPHWGPPQP